MDNLDLAQRLARLSPAKRALLELEIKQQSLDADGLLVIPRRLSRHQAPLSSAQRRLWFLNQLEPDNPNYNESSALRLIGLLDIEALQTALNGIVTRHEVLRATIATQDGVAIQTIRQPQRADLEVIDLRRTEVGEREGEAGRRLLDAVRRPFDLTADLMLRPLLVRLDEQDHILLLVTHHIASDGWSANILWRELSELYRAETLGVAPQIAELPIQYQDYAEWQLQWFSERQVQGQLAFWKSHLEGLQPLRLPTDRPVPLERQWHGARRMAPLDANLLESIAAFSRAHGVTQFMTLVAAFQVLLHRYCGQDDIAIGTPIAGRNRTEVEGLIGFFVNTLILRTDLGGNPTFADLLGRVRDIALNAYNNQDIPFEKLVEELNPQRSLSQTPLFNVLFAYQNRAKPLPELPGLTQSPYEIFNGAAKCDFYLSVVNRETEPMLRAEYDRDLFEAATVERMLRHYRALLESFVADPALRINDAPLLSAAERHQLLVEWNDTKTDYPSDQCIHQLFEAQADKIPDAVAVVFDDQQLTYRELNSRANQLARRLAKLGIGPAMAVGVCLERSIELIVGLLAILKRGGTYVPLDPSYPQERLRFMIEDAQLKALLTRESAAPRFADSSIEIVPIELTSDEEPQTDGSDLRVNISPDLPAYVIYTSGSTGLPKGVSVSHRAVDRLVLQTDYVAIALDDAIAQVSNVSFDAATFEIWGALLNGARVVVIDKETLLSPPAFAAVIAAHSITTLFLTTALFNQMVEQIPQALGGLRYLLFGGETANRQKVEAFL
ncbi:MAG TPA: condensation domain-containing protein, partial [Candidatus Binatia bacterium]